MFDYHKFNAFTLTRPFSNMHNKAQLVSQSLSLPVANHSVYSHREISFTASLVKKKKLVQHFQVFTRLKLNYKIKSRNQFLRKLRDWFSNVGIGNLLILQANLKY